MLKFQMNIHITGIQKESLFMITLIGLDGAPEVCPDHRRDEFGGCVRQRHWKRKERSFPKEESDLKFGVSSQRPMKGSNQDHRPRLLT